MRFNVLLLSLFTYAFLFNPWLIDLDSLQDASFFKRLISPQLYFLLILIIFLYRSTAVRSFMQQHLTQNIARYMGIGLAYALLAPIVLLLALSIYNFMQFKNGLSLFIPWEGQANCLFTLTDLFFLWILAPISEELFFRGLLFPSFKQRYNLHLAVLLSALFFMSTHGSYHLGSLVLGITMAYATHYHQSLWPAIVFHAVSNAYAPVLCWYFPKLLKTFENFAWVFFVQK